MCLTCSNTDGRACKIVRLLGVEFPSITMNNLMVISVERYLSTRAIPRTLSVSSVRKLIFTAWLVGSFIVLFPVATFNGIRYDIDDSHYTVLCNYDKSNLTSRIIIVCYTALQHLIPSAILSYANISVAKTLWTRKKIRIDIQRNNVIKSSLVAAKLRGTYLLVAITFAFIIPHSALLYYATYRAFAKPSIDFQTDYIKRYLSGGLFYSTSTINFIICTVQMKDFRAFLKNLFCGKGNAMNPNPHREGIQLGEVQLRPI